MAGIRVLYTHVGQRCQAVDHSMSHHLHAVLRDIDPKRNSTTSPSTIT